MALDDDIRKYVPELPVYDPARPILVRDVLHMTAGLPSYEDLFDDLTDETNESVVAALARQSRLGHPTGTRYEYSNTSYVLLAAIVARVAKQSFGEFLKAFIFDPIGMRHTHLDEAGDGAQGYKRTRSGRFVIDRYDTPGIAGDGGILSTAGDLLQYDRAMRAGRLVKPETQRMILTSGRLDSGRRVDYGFGLMLYQDDSTRAAWHNGSWYGTATYFSRHLDKDVVVIVLLNDSDGEATEVGEEIETWLEDQ